MPKQWAAEELLEIARAYQPTAVLAAAADLDVFGLLAATPATAAALAARLSADVRGLTALLDALAALELLEKREATYFVPAGVAELLTDRGAHNVLPMVRHQANCLRRWVQLAEVVKNGGPARRTASIRGEAADQEAFIGAMHNVSGPVAGPLVADLGRLEFRHLLDIGGASGTWTIAFLRAVPGATATIFDLPPVIPLARKRLTDEGLVGRVSLVAGDFNTDPLPAGADFAWFSAIAHQNSRPQNRAIYGKIHAALTAGGRLLIRDVVMEESRMRPVAGALFAINMLVATEGGGTFTLSEYRDDLEAAGFGEVRLLRRHEGMDAVIEATKSGGK